MQNTNQNTSTTETETAKLAEEVQKAIIHDGDIENTVRDLTLKAMHANGIELESLQKIATAVLKGIQEGAQEKIVRASEQSSAAKSQITQAVAGLDSAFAQLAGASKLALEEAAGKAKQFSEDELTETRANLEKLENIFLDTLKQTTTAAQDVISDVFKDLLTHAQHNGTTVGKQLKDTLAVFTHQMASTGRTQFEAGVKLTQTTVDLLYKISTGVLSGITSQKDQQK